MTRAPVIKLQRSLLLLASLLCMLVCGCTPVRTYTPPPREPVVFPNLIVWVYDDQTGEWLTGATVTARRDDGVQTTVAENKDFAGCHTATCPAGTYTVTVERAGYDPIAASGIQLLAGQYWEQELVPVDVVVRLTPSGTATQKQEVRS